MGFMLLLAGAALMRVFYVAIDKYALILLLTFSIAYPAIIYKYLFIKQRHNAQIKERGIVKSDENIFFENFVSLFGLVNGLIIQRGKSKRTFIS